MFSQRNRKQNVKNADYANKPFSADCSIIKPMDLALLTSMFYKGSHQVGMGGCNIEQNSRAYYLEVN